VTLRLNPLGSALALLYMAGVVRLSSMPGRELVAWGWPVRWLDLVHVPLFAGMALVTLWAVVGPPRPVRAALVMAACLLFAVSDEWHQSYVPGRVASLADLRLDALGIVLGLAIGLTLPALGGICRGVAAR
jgi:VanZ family protein